MAYSKEMKEYAKQLFFTPNIYGEHKYGWTAISGKIQEKYNLEKAPDPSTVQKWSQDKDDNNNSWESLWKQALISGVTSSHPTQPPDGTLQPDEEAYYRVDAFQRLMGNIGQDLMLKGYKFFEDESWKPADIKDAKTAFDIGIKIYEVQHRVVEGDKLNIEVKNDKTFNKDVQEKIILEGSNE